MATPTPHKVHGNCNARGKCQVSRALQIKTKSIGNKLVLSYELEIFQNVLTHQGQICE